jgi:hypothetical protein
MAAAQFVVFDPGSPFFQALRAEALPSDPSELLVKAHLLGRTRRASDGTALSDGMERARIMALLGEPLRTPRTIDEAITQEKASTETLEALLKRAMNAQISVERADDSTADSFRYSGRLSYWGHGVWQGGATNRRVWMRVKVSSRSDRPIRLIGISIPYPADSNRRFDFWQCSFEGDGILAPRASAYAMCLDAIDVDKPDDALRAISAKALTQPIELTRIEMPDMRLVVHNSTLPEDNNRLGKASDEAERILSATPCERLNACAQLAELKAQAADRRYKTSPAYFATLRDERAAKGATKIAAGCVLTFLLMVVLATKSRAPGEPLPGRTPGIAAAGIFLTGALVLACAIPVMLEWPTARGYGGFLFLIPAVCAGLVLAMLVVLLGAMVINPGHRTRVRLAAVGFGAGALGILLSAFAP